MRHNAQHAEAEREAVYKEEKLYGDDSINKAREEFLCEDSVLFDELREVVQAGGCREQSVFMLRINTFRMFHTYSQGKKGKAEDNAYVADER